MKKTAIIKASAVLGLIFIFILGISFFTKKDEVLITVSKLPTIENLSKSEGMLLTPTFKSSVDGGGGENVIFKWQTTFGEFLGVGQSVESTDESQVIWIQNDDESNSNQSFDITLTVTGTESKRVLAKKKLTLIPKNGSYEVK